ncbi:MAG TPA: PDZ domain-containing protein, partial [Tepidisphaeraceae bacterium]|nr:PDZ domain-containing protein [Tepidisphaeraceae bacterium]
MRWSLPAIALVGCLAVHSYAADPVQSDDARPSEPPVQQLIPDSVHAFRMLVQQERRLEKDLRPWTEETVKGAYLGVNATEAPPVLRHQLGLPEGMGLVVEFVAPKSPAEEAGIKQYDVLQKLEDQRLVNPEQLAVLVRSFKPGEEIKLTLWREGKQMTLTAKLAEHELAPLDAFNLDRIPWSLREPIAPRPPLMRPGMPGDVPLARPQKRNLDSTVTWLDGDHSYTVSSHDGHQTLVVKDRDDHVLFDGPIDTQQQRDKLPSDLREKLDRMMKSGLVPPHDANHGS